MKIIKKLLIFLSTLYNRFKRNKIISFIYYHDIVEKEGSSYSKTSIKVFRSHMKFMHENGYQAISLDEIDTIPKQNNSGKYFNISFDDGYKSIYELVYPIMKEYKMKFSIFLEYGAIDMKNNYLTWDMIKEMNKSGLVSFGAHTKTHKDTRYINESNYIEEIVQVNSGIFDKINCKVFDFCFPFGTFNNKTINFIAERNLYKRLYTADGSRIKKIKNIIFIGRVGVEESDNLLIFKKKINGDYDIFYTLIRKIKLLNRKNKNEFFRKN